MTPEQIQQVITASSAALAVFEGPDHRMQFCTDAWRSLWGDSAVTIKAVRAAFDRCLADGTPVATEVEESKLICGRWRDGDASGVVAVAEDEAERARLFNMLGHELRGPMAPLLTAIDLTRVDPSGASNAKAMAIIERQAKTLLQRIDNLLDVSRAARGKLELHNSRVDLGERVRAGVDQIKPRIDQRGHKVEVDAPDGLPVDGDSRRIAQLVANLVDNAVLYSEPAAPRPITVRCYRRGTDGVVEVTDSGRGIDPREIEQIFEPFVQGARVSAGLGLGLAFVRQVAELHGGRASVLSEGEGHGATFTVVFPLAS